MISVKEYEKTLKGKQVLKNINLTFEEGGLYLLKGHNGCGKTMLLRAICGLIAPSHGEVVCDEMYDFGVVIENPSFIDNETAFYNLKYLADINKKIGKEQIEEYLKLFHLFDSRNKKVKSFSLGMKQRLGIAQAVMEDPDVVLLDEPFNALDEESYDIVFEHLIQLRDRGKIVIVAAHAVDKERQECFDEVIEMNDGALKTS
ncbi:MAG: ABC transporter ATP-binding protein [Lachnospiraceae bacterium]|nr:ABC transporter ATP-binding protein [Lachnospiraceae bacterium]